MARRAGDGIVTNGSSHTVEEPAAGPAPDLPTDTECIPQEQADDEEQPEAQIGPTAISDVEDAVEVGTASDAQPPSEVGSECLPTDEAQSSTRESTAPGAVQSIDLQHVVCELQAAPKDRVCWGLAGLGMRMRPLWLLTSCKCAGHGASWCIHV